MKKEQGVYVLISITYDYGNPNIIEVYTNYEEAKKRKEFYEHDCRHIPYIAPNGQKRSSMVQECLIVKRIINKADPTFNENNNIVSDLLLQGELSEYKRQEEGNLTMST